ncbi:hypothetical protein C8Q75DRAFT_718580 [Abortiporus biennis]|nr:hypothetical protein C8Q75DRAFT_718580 [Abortiporus biennis]
MDSKLPLNHQLEELNLLKCSLLEGESLTFIPPYDPDAESWKLLLDSYAEGTLAGKSLPSTPARFQVKSSSSRIWFEVELPLDYASGSSAATPLQSMISVRGDEITRSEQEHWQKFINECTSELSESEYPIYELISTHLLSRLHDTVNAENSSTVEAEAHNSSSTDISARTPIRYHALLTSHHLISPTKRRNLQSWSSELSITGFAKVGYPGVIYCEGEQSQVEEFVGNVKAMQWLALRVRFVEPVPCEGVNEGLGMETNEGSSKKRWVEFEKVGEVVQEMRRLGRENYVVEMGIGSAWTASGNT